MGLALIDWIIIGLYLALSLGVGLYFTRQAGKDIREYFLSGRKLPWWLLGTSMVATTFGADTPLAVTEYVRNEGIWRNWFWWNAALGGLLSVFLFSRLWRRAEVLTDNELIELRYSGRPAAILRAFKAGYFATLYNFVVMGWVIQAMATVLQVVLGIPREMQWLSIALCVVISLVYTVLSGLWGVVATDLFQFGLAMAGSIILAIFSLKEIGGIGELKIRLAEVSTVNDSTLYFLPPLDVGSSHFWTSPFFTFIIFITVMWWATHHADGGGYIIQRMLAAKSEGHSLVGTLWFSVAHYALRPWPWIIVALVSLVTFPHHPAKEAYPATINFLPPGLRGLLVVSFLAAFMSTIVTHVNWGSSYFINDIYKRFIVKEASERHYILVSRISGAVLMVIAGGVATQMDSITKAWEFLAPMAAGIGLVLILRWFWWRINAWSEISALIASVVINILLELMGVGIQYRFALIVPSSIIIWVTVTFLTRPVPKEKLMEFYQKVRPGGFWRPIQKELPHIKKGIIGWGLAVDWFSGVALIYGTTFGIGEMVFQEYAQGLILLGMAALGAAVISYRLTRKEAFQ
ncbi:MAG: sodium:solute symporter family protein [Candidatus Brocadiales bacterium]|nr:sodium:solute symporter family protein [Candidatus Brocadiales bacterium]